MLSLYIKLCRPLHVIKNLLVLLPPFFGHKFIDKSIIPSSILAIISFSLVASSVYIFNDLLDRENDKLHPFKKNRPIASGNVSITGAYCLISLLLVCSCLILFISTKKLVCFFILFIYFCTNIGYSISWKKIPVVDIFVLALGFVLRVYFGGAWFNITISSWLFLCVMCGALCFATGKRRNELLRLGNDTNTRYVLKQYTINFLNNSYYLLCAITIVFFSLWTILGRGEVQHNNILQFSIPLVIFIFFRYNYLIETTDTDGDPLTILLSDRILIILSFLFAFISYIGIYII